MSSDVKDRRCDVEALGFGVFVKWYEKWMGQKLDPFWKWTPLKVECSMATLYGLHGFLQRAAFMSSQHGAVLNGSAVVTQCAQGTANILHRRSASWAIDALS
jgi:hypothetical protein